jgi:glycosyltransferase involved in cell wall biosynthesis
MRWSKLHLWMAGAAKENPLTRILFVSGTIPPDPCGVGDYTFKLARSLASMPNIQAAILTGAESAAPVAKTDVPTFPLIQAWTPGHLRQAIRFFRSWKPDVVHVQYPTQGYRKGILPYILPLAARILGIASVQTWHEGFGRRDTIKLFTQLISGSQIVVVRANFLDLVHPWLRRLVELQSPLFIANASAIPRADCSTDDLLHERRLLLQGQRRLVLFFGFLYPAKQVELLFEIADPLTDHIVIAGPAEPDSPYLAKLEALAARAEWKGKVTFTGFTSPERAAILLAAADAVILPFRNGGGHWNTSLHSAILNGASIITTSIDRVGYDDTANVFYARPDAVDEMRSALTRYGRRRDNFNLAKGVIHDEWKEIAQKHYQIYNELLGNPR